MFLNAPQLFQVPEMTKMYAVKTTRGLIELLQMCVTINRSVHYVVVTVCLSITGICTKWCIIYPCIVYKHTVIVATLLYK